jgi:hypothetical protein
VQVASELSEVAYRNRVAQVRADGQLPPDTHYVTDSGDCGLFTAQEELWVLYAGPFDSVEAACPARMASPPDAFVKGITADTRQMYFGCLCATSVAQLPTITAGTNNTWVGELQRALRVKQHLEISDIDGPPALWGSATPDTVDAVTSFQANAGLTPTGVVESATWAALATASC